MEHNHGPGDEFVPKEKLHDLLSTMKLDDKEDGDNAGNKSKESADSGTGSSLYDSFMGMSFVDKKVFVLYQCSFCGNCSAALRKCARCGAARYCNTDWYVMVDAY
jgi:ribosomal protein L44E